MKPRTDDTKSRPRGFPAARWSTAGHRLALAAAVSLLPKSAFAHHLMDSSPHTWYEGILAGIVHPIAGIDHLLFLLMAGILAFALERQRRVLTAVGFVVGGLLGSSLHLAALGLPAVELFVSMSVVAGGATVLSRYRPGTVGLCGFFAVAGVFHGYAFAGPVLDVAVVPLAGYLAGLTLAQFAIVAGLPAVLSMASEWARHESVARFERVSAAMALLGGVILVALDLI